MEFKSLQICKELPGITQRHEVTGAGLHWSSMSLDLGPRCQTEIAMDMGSFLEQAGLHRVRKTTSK